MMLDISDEAEANQYRRKLRLLLQKKENCSDFDHKELDLMQWEVGLMWAQT